MNETLDTVSDFDLFNWGKYLFYHIATVSASRYTKFGDTKQINNAVHDFTHVFPQTDEFKSSVASLFGIPIHYIEQHHHSLSITALLRIQDLYFHTRAVTHQTDDLASNSLCIPAMGSDSKVRYVAGMCVGRVIHKECEFLCRNIHTESDQLSKKRLLVMTLRKHLYNTIHIAQSESSYPESLLEITHRQSKYGHLTIVDDLLFTQFKEFDRHLHPHLTVNALRFHDDHLFSTLLNNTMDDMFTESNVNIPECFTFDILKPVFSKYLRVCLKELGVRITSKLNVKKKMAHRKQVLLEECTGNKVPKSGSEASSVKPSTSSQGIPQIPKDITAASVDSLACPSTHDNDTTDELEECKCILCGAPYVKNRLNWIECTQCKLWLHRKCDKSLKPQKRWKAAIADGAIYHCPVCIKGESAPACVCQTW